MNAPVAGKKKGRVDLDCTREALEQLGLSHAAEGLGERLTRAVKEEVAAHRFLDDLLAAETRKPMVCTVQHARVKVPVGSHPPAVGDQRSVM